MRRTALPREFSGGWSPARVAWSLSRCAVGGKARRGQDRSPQCSPPQQRALCNSSRRRAKSPGQRDRLASVLDEQPQLVKKPPAPSPWPSSSLPFVLTRLLSLLFPRPGSSSLFLAVFLGQRSHSSSKRKSFSRVCSTETISQALCSMPGKRCSPLLTKQVRHFLPPQAIGTRLNPAAR